MTKSTRILRSRLLSSACVSVLALSAGQAFAQEATVTGSYSEAVIQSQTTATTSASIVRDDEDATTVEPSSLVITAGDVLDSTLAVGGTSGLGNVASATSFGNESTQSITTNLNNDFGAGSATGTVSASTGVAGSTTDMGFAVAQNFADSISTATNTTDMGISAADVTNSTLNVQRNTTEAIAVFNRSTVTATANVNDTSATTGIAVTQVATGGTLGSATTATNSIAISEDATDSTASLTNNLQRSVGVGNVSTTNQTLTGNNVTLPANIAPTTASLSVSDADAVGGYATASGQTLTGSTLSATTDGEGAGFVLSVADNAINSTIANSSNTASSTLLGNESGNAISLNANSVTTAVSGVVDSGTVAAIASVQSVIGSTLTATTMGTSGDAVTTSVGTDLTDSTVRSNANTIGATATGNQGSNSITANVTTLDTSGTLNGSSVSNFDTSTATAAFAVSSAQVVDGASSITASLVDDVTTPTSGASVRVVVGDDVLSSTIEANRNTLTAAATGNLILAGSNSVTLTGTTINTTTAVANTQNMMGDVSAVIGAPGTPATEDAFVAGDPVPGSDVPGPDVEHTVTVAINVVSYEFESFFVFRGDYYVLAQGLSVDDITVLEAGGYILVSNYIINGSPSGQAYVLPDAAKGLFIEEEDRLTTTTSLKGDVAGPDVAGLDVDGDPIFVAGLPAMPGSGVSVIIADDILASTISVDGNTVDGSVTGNAATNRITVSATDLGEGGTLTTAAIEPTSTGIVASADHAVNNVQRVGVVDLTTTVASEFGIFTQGTGLAAEGEANSAVVSSSLSVSNNTQMATTIANSGTNAVSLSATNLESSAAVVSTQLSRADVVANSTMSVTAPAANDSSTLEMNANRNQSVATGNTATNTVSVSATNVTSISGGEAAALEATYRTDDAYAISGLDFTAYADSALMNLQQTIDGSITATATTSVVNLDGRDGTFVTDGVVNSTIEVMRNVTVAEASANRSVNTMTLAGGATSDMAGAVLNAQDNRVDVDAVAAARIGVSLTGDEDLPAASQSMITVGGNATLGQATGNRATNVLNASALGMTPDPVIGSTAALDDANGTSRTTATYGVLNMQGNGGDVSAVVTASYGASFALAGGTAIDASRVSVTGNSVQGVATGNVASNSLTLASLNPGAATSAIGSTQLNTGNISSVVTASMGITSAGNVSQSTLAATGNTISSSAVGNSVTSTMVRN